jgi:hypothetical protein
MSKPIFVLTRMPPFAQCATYHDATKVLFNGPFQPGGTRPEEEAHNAARPAKGLRAILERDASHTNGQQQAKR